MCRSGDVDFNNNKVNYETKDKLYVRAESIVADSQPEKELLKLKQKQMEC